MKKIAIKTKASKKTAEDILRRKRLDGLKSMRGRMKVVDYSTQLRKMELDEIKGLDLIRGSVFLNRNPKT